MRAWLASLFLVAALSCPAVAQNAGEPAPGQLEAARELLKITNTEGLLKDSAEGQAVLITQQIQRAIPDVAPEALVLLKQITREEIEKSVPRQLDGSAKIYSRHFSESDLRGLIAFYKTPLGSKLITQLPEVMKECSEIGAELSGSILIRFREELAKLDAHSAPEQKP